MPYTEIQTNQFSRGFRLEVDFILVPGSIVVARNNQYAYEEVQYWGALFIGDYDLFDGGNVLVTQTVLCYNKAHSIRVPESYPVNQFPGIYSPQNYKENVLNVTFFQYVP